MNHLQTALIKTPAIGRIVLFFYRARMGIAHLKRPCLNLISWLFSSREITNFTYDLEDHNKQYLSTLISDLTGESADQILQYLSEIESDSQLLAHVRAETKGSKLAAVADREVRFGRRIGWYALARAMKPRTIVETGVDKGLGACVLTAALRRNSEEGFEGKYFGTDINPEAGYLLSGDYEGFGKVLYGDSIASLQAFDRPIDLFINDSSHSAEYEAEEYRTVADKLSQQAVILGDNAHCTDKLMQFSLRANRKFIYFQENPKNHWYRGAGIGFSFVR